MFLAFPIERGYAKYFLYKKLYKIINFIAYVRIELRKNNVLTQN